MDTTIQKFEEKTVKLRSDFEGFMKERQRKFDEKILKNQRKVSKKLKRQPLVKELSVIGKKRKITEILRKEDTFINYTKMLLPHVPDETAKIFASIRDDITTNHQICVKSIKDLYLYDIQNPGYQWRDESTWHPNVKIMQNTNKSKVEDCLVNIYKKAYETLEAIQSSIFNFITTNDFDNSVRIFATFTIDNGTMINNLDTVEEVYYYSETLKISVETPRDNYRFLKNITHPINLLFNRNADNISSYLSNSPSIICRRYIYLTEMTSGKMEKIIKNVKDNGWIVKEKPRKIFKSNGAKYKNMWYIFDRDIVRKNYIKDLDFIHDFTDDFKYQLYSGQRYVRPTRNSFGKTPEKVKGMVQVVETPPEKVKPREPDDKTPDVTSENIEDILKNRYSMLFWDKKMRYTDKQISDICIHARAWYDFLNKKRRTAYKILETMKKDTERRKAIEIYDNLCIELEAIDNRFGNVITIY